MEVTTEIIWNDFEQKLLNFIQSKVNNKEIAKDILQDVFVKIHINIQKLTDSTKLTSWVYQITRNAIIDHYRKDKKLTDKIPDIPETIEEGNLNDKFKGCLQSHINQLPEKYKDAILKTSFQGMSQKEYAKEIDLSYSSTKSRVQRARKKLNQLFIQCCAIQADQYGNIISSRTENCSC